MGLRMDDLHAPTVGSGPTSQPLSNGTEGELTLQELIAKKENLEAELTALGSVLDSHNVDMNTPLLTPDGFPRADIDVAQIRTTRSRIIFLKNNHKDLMRKLEVAVQEAFATGKAPDVPATTASNAAPRAPAVQAEPSAASSGAAIEPPFARVNTVAPNSPADQAGMLAGDKVTRFGTANWTNHERLSKVAQVVQNNENRAIIVKVLREGSSTAASQPLELQLTPRRDWGGRGLLGCHLLPI
ncbi:hypothetical protein NU195Hw_g565t1 [Hortaea werneckii]